MGNKNIKAYSAGIVRNGLDQNAIKVMAEIGIDISHHKSKTMGKLNHVKFDYIIALSVKAFEKCVFNAGRAVVIYKRFDNPRQVAEKAVTADSILTHYRRVRDEIREFLDTVPEPLREELKSA